MPRFALLGFALAVAVVLAAPAGSGDGDGDRIAFVITSIEGSQVVGWIGEAGADGRLRRLVTQRPTSGSRRVDSSPSWSPDGRRVVFWRRNPTGRGSGAFVREGRKSPVRIPTTGALSFPNWSQDAKSLAFGLRSSCHPTKRAAARLLIALADGSGSRSISALPRPAALVEGAYPLAWSPDGKRLAYGVSFARGPDSSGDRGSCDPRYGYSKLYAIGSDGSTRVLVAEDSWIEWAAWSPDGRHIAYASGYFGSYGVYLANADGTGVPVEIGETGRHLRDAVGTTLTWTPDGKTLLSTGFEGLYAISLTNGARSKLMGWDSTEPIPQIADLSSDGKRIAIVEPVSFGDDERAVTTIYTVRLADRSVKKSSPISPTGWFGDVDVFLP